MLTCITSANYNFVLIFEHHLQLEVLYITYINSSPLLGIISSGDVTTTAVVVRGGSPAVVVRGDAHSFFDLPLGGDAPAVVKLDVLYIPGDV